jgi:multicomponent K+:H+ antiporter subunit G
MTGTQLSDWIALPAGLLLIAGGAFTLIGALGLVRMRDFYSRMHPATLGTTLGAACVLVSSMLVSATVHEILIAVFLFTTSPVSAITLMHAAMARTRRRATP